MRRTRSVQNNRCSPRRIIFRLGTVIAGWGVLAAVIGLPPAIAAVRPNIVLIMVDDMGYSDLGCYGSEIATPHLDRLARDGMRFTQFYNCAKCTTTRAALLTGLYPRPEGQLLKDNMITIADGLRAAGYQTSLSGKWHLGSKQDRRPIDRGFDEFYGLMDGCCNFFNPAQRDPPFKGGRVRVFGHNDQLIDQFPEDYYTTDAFTDHAIATMRRYVATHKPFFIHLCYTAPHYPLHAKPAEIEKYRGQYMMGWEELRKARFQRQKEMGLFHAEDQLSGTDSNAYSWDAANHCWEDLRMAVYAAMLDRVDQNVGRLLNELRRLEVSDNTVVMFLSDNGGCSEEPGGRDEQSIPGPRQFYTAVGPAWGWAQNTPFRRYKSWVHEGGICTPLIVRWPGVVAAGTLTRQVGHVIDLLPTCLEIAGGEYPDQVGDTPILPVEGASLVSVFGGQTRREHATLCWEWNRNRAIRQGKWKLVWDRLVRRWELYDIVADRTETQDLAGQDPQRVAQMSEAWFQWARKTGVRWQAE